MTLDAIGPRVPHKPVCWVGRSRTDLASFPDPVKRRMGGALWEAQIGRTTPFSKRLHGFGPGVLEVTDAFFGVAYRLVYVVRFAEAIYVLHAFKKKSTRGRMTPRRHVAVIRERLKQAEEEHERWQRSANGGLH